MNFIKNLESSRIRQILDKDYELTSSQVQTYFGGQITCQQITNQKFRVIVIITDTHLVAIERAQIILKLAWDDVLAMGKGLMLGGGGGIVSSIKLMIYTTNVRYPLWGVLKQYPFNNYAYLELDLNKNDDEEFQKILNDKFKARGLRDGADELLDEWYREYIPEVPNENEWPEDMKQYRNEIYGDLLDATRLIIFAGKKFCFGAPVKLLEMALEELELLRQQAILKFKLDYDPGENLKKLIERTQLFAADKRQTQSAWRNPHLAPNQRLSDDVISIDSSNEWFPAKVEARDGIPLYETQMSVPEKEWQGNLHMSYRRAYVRALPEDTNIAGMGGYPRLEIWNDFNDGTLATPLSRTEELSSDKVLMRFPNIFVEIKKIDYERVMQILNGKV